MYLHEILKLINRNALRSVEKWCRKNNVNIYKDSSGKFVMKADFELAYDWPLIQNLKTKFGDKWRIYYEAYLKENLADVIEFANSKNSQGKYEPKGNISKKLFGSSSK